ncbi:hypothetical protein EJV47_18620 [Hymenobacter gummosus]|uniref:Toxin-antitoxin system YwqK family antitoxin n=1 Tax=Hymenobacter gummosus TaxID=1776032 RepID=A0A431TZF9_9BACT|nr:hypothetical protein [Hymenobacter gummosus]RTQ47441.1 hypothetical protein EJV47_18620 [Hymenobacter gummosus]
MLFRLPLGATVLLGLAAASSQAQQVNINQPAAKASLRDCYQSFAGDSVELYYNGYYQLTPKACATIRRNTHLDATGTFSGLVCDYQLADGRRLNRQYYRGGKRNGLYEEYYSDGKVLARGQYQNGLPTGIWQYWYPSGQARQTLMWGENLNYPFRILAYWEPSGQQLCKDGQGTWREEHSNGYIRFGGPVVDGLAHGTWSSVVIRTGAPFSEERYEQGRFIEGFDLNNKRRRYPGPAGLQPTVQLPTDAAEAFTLNQPCEVLQAQAVRSNHRAVPPQAPGGLRDYNDRLLKMLRKQVEAEQGLGMRGNIVLFVDVGTSGQLTLDESSRDMQYARPILDLLNRLPQWKPATLDGQPVPGRLTVEMEIGLGMVSSRVMPSLKDPVPPLKAVGR